MSDSHPLKAHALTDLEAAVSKAIFELTGQTVIVDVTSLSVDQQTTADAFIGRRASAHLHLTVKPTYANESEDDAPWDLPRA
jgi:hypothetical protein